MSRGERDASLSGSGHMSPGKKANAGHSIFERLLNYAKEHREDFNLLLFSYGIERLCRSTSIPRGLPIAFTDGFRKDAQKQTQWRAFIRKAKPDTMTDSLDVLMNDIETFMMPVVDAVRQGKLLKLIWKRGGRWSKEAEDR